MAVVIMMYSSVKAYTDINLLFSLSMNIFFLTNQSLKKMHALK